MKNYPQKKFIKAVLFGIFFSCSMSAMENGEILRQEKESPSLSLTERIEFAFVLLPDQSVLEDIQKLAHTVAGALATLEKRPSNPVWESYYDKVVDLPHVSIGQYGFLGREYASLADIISQTAQKFKPFTEPVLRELSVTEENIFLDFQGTRESTNPIIKDMYIELRTQFMDKMATKFPITQALLERLDNKDNSEELRLIDECYQNWGTPEKNRIRPHFTLFYNYAASKEAAKKALVNIPLPSALENITLTRIGIVQIDTWGNPTKLLYATCLSS